MKDHLKKIIKEYEHKNLQYTKGTVETLIDAINELRKKERKLAWYEKNFGKWADGDKIKSIIRRQKTDKERIRELKDENKELRHAYESLVFIGGRTKKAQEYRTTLENK